jgi:hypothetical protein
MRPSISLLLLSAAALGGCGRAAATDAPGRVEAEALHTAVRDLTDVIVYDIFSPPQASRVYAYASVAAYEVLRQGDSTHHTLAGQVNGLTPVPAPEPGVEYSLPLAGVHAFMAVGRQLTFSRDRMDSLRTAMDARFRESGMPAPVYERSIAYGERVAKHVLAWAAADSFTQTRGYPKYAVTAEPGRWVPTPPAYMDAVEPNWGRLRPFVMDSGSQFRPAVPVAFDSVRASAFVTQAADVYETGRHLTAEQRAIAAFWDCNPYVMHVQGHAMFATKKISPGGHWMGITAIAARQADAGILESAEAYARTAMAIADGFISAWDEKFRSNVLRPETVINAYLDEGWEPLLQTPPFPEYPSAHSVISAAAATVLTEEFGEGFAFVDSVEVDYGLTPRHFASFDQAAREAAISRIYGGIHYRASVEVGVGQGRHVGERLLQRVRTHDRPHTPRVVAVRPR